MNRSLNLYGKLCSLNNLQIRDFGTPSTFSVFVQQFFISEFAKKFKKLITSFSSKGLFSSLLSVYLGSLYANKLSVLFNS